MGGSGSFSMASLLCLAVAGPYCVRIYGGRRQGLVAGRTCSLCIV